MDAPELLYLENEKLVPFILHKYFPAIAGDEDVQQIARMAMWVACKGYSPDKGALSTYAWLLIRRDVLRHLDYLSRKGRSAPRSSLDAEVANAEDCTLLDALQGAADVDWIDTEAIAARLTPQHKQICRWLLEGVPQPEIARRLGVSASTVGNRCREIRAIIIENA